jgi:hypothetical protein
VVGEHLAGVGVGEALVRQRLVLRVTFEHGLARERQNVLEDDVHVKHERDAVAAGSQEPSAGLEPATSHIAAWAVAACSRRREISAES